MRKLLPLVLVAACGGGNAKPDALIINPKDGPTPDSKQIDAPPQGPNLVTYTLFDMPVFAAYRDGQGPWQTVTQDSMGAYSLYVTNDYQFVYVCVGTGMIAGSFDAELYEATATDFTQNFAFCNVPTSTPPPTTVAVTGHMTQAGTVMMQDMATSQTPSWDFTLNVDPITHDLVAFDATDMQIQRGLNITGAMTLPAIDVAANGAAMVPTALTINGRVAGDMVTSQLALETQNDFFQFTETATSVNAPPPSQLMPNDFQFLFVYDQTASTNRYADGQFDGSAVTYTLMPQLTGINYDTTGGTLTATWGTLPTYDQISLFAFSGTGVSTQAVHATQAWLTAAHASDLAFDVTPTGYDASWKIDLTGTYFRQFEADQTVGAVSYGTAVYESAGLAAFRSRARAVESFRARHHLLGRSRGR